MCGIVGVFHAGSADIGAEIVGRMNATITHRGPDDHGAWCATDVAVAMRRLSIIDLAGGHQPMRTDDGVVIVFNGEVYNYRELRKELQELGYNFRTNSDTEVVLKLYHHAGVTGLDRLDGMYGVCIVDNRRGEAHLVRDRMGIKPLYYGVQNGRFYFASEIKAILAGMAAKPEPSALAIFHYLTLRYVPSPDTAWNDIHKLQPGQRLTYRFADAGWSIHQYWQCRFLSQAPDITRNYEKEFEDVFLGAVKSHLVTSDVPVGILLSGGLDSSAVAAASMELGFPKLHTFTVGFRDGGRFSELAYARQVAEHIGAQHHEILIGEDEFIDFLDDFVWHMDEPQADLASIPLHYVSQLARQHVKVVLSGEGADEILAGYDLEKFARQADARRRWFSWVPSTAFKLGAMFFSGQRAATLNLMAQEGWSGYVKAWAAHDNANWMDDEKLNMWRSNVPSPLTADLMRSRYNPASSPMPVDKVQQVLCGDWLVEDLLMKADKMTMANSIELRVPFLDRSVVEWAQSLPLEWKVGDRAHGYVSKRVLRAYARSRLPSAIIDRPKEGFPVPAYVWLQNKLGQWAQDRLRDAEATLGHWIDMSRVTPVMAAARGGDIKAAHKVWLLIVLDTWVRRWL